MQWIIVVALLIFVGYLIINRGPSLHEYVSKTTGMTFQPIPAGEFRMGSSAADVQGYVNADQTIKPDDIKNEQPQHTVEITRPFYMGTYEATQSEFRKIMNRNPSEFAPTGNSKNNIIGSETNKFPVERVTWYDAVEFCNKLSEKDGFPPYYTLADVQRAADGAIQSCTVARTKSGGRSYRLPTEAEWEYAARAGTTTAYHFGDVLNGSQSNVDGTRPFGTTDKGTNLGMTKSVGSFPKNDFGLYDMCGNVWEWCDDVYDEKLYVARTGVTTDPLNTSVDGMHVERGGSWANPAKETRSAYRSWDPPKTQNRSTGFRVALSRE